jgi:hypothetical protein
MAAIWGVTLCSHLHVNRRFIYAVYMIRAIGLMMEAVTTSTTSVNIYQTAWRNIQEDSHLNVEFYLSSPIIYFLQQQHKLSVVELIEISAHILCVYCVYKICICSFSFIVCTLLTSPVKTDISATVLALHFCGMKFFSLACYRTKFIMSLPHCKTFW